MTTMIKVRFQVVGWHYWEGAKVGRRYLSSQHRHTFHFQVDAKVKHTDRDIEFHDLIEEAKATLRVQQDGNFEDGFNFKGQSCEAIAMRLLESLALRLDVTAVEVWEDGECGARVEI